MENEIRNEELLYYSDSLSIIIALIAYRDCLLVYIDIGSPYCIWGLCNHFIKEECLDEHGS